MNMDIEKICMIFAMQEPFYGIVLSSMLRVPEEKVGTLAVGRSGNVFRLYYNPKFIAQLSVDETLECLKHECLHLALNHFTLWETDDISPAEHRLRNIAEDLEVNSYIKADVLKRIGICLASQFGWENELGAREYFRRLLKKAQEDQQKKNQQKKEVAAVISEQGEEASKDEEEESQMPTGGSSEPDEANLSPGNGEDDEMDLDEDVLPDVEQFDDHSYWPQNMTPEEEQDMQNMVDTMLVYAADEVEKAQGEIPGEMKGKIEQLRKKPKPVADWRRYCRRYLGNEFSEIIKKSKKRESRRFPDAAGNRHRRKSNILVAIDTSGSVSMEELQEFFQQIHTLSAVANFRVLECDTQIAHEYDFRGKPNLDLHGGGGTSFYPPIQYFNQNRRKYDALVYFTDGYATVPADTPKDTLWIISSKGDQTRSKYTVNGAKCAFIPKH